MAQRELFKITPEWLAETPAEQVAAVFEGMMEVVNACQASHDLTSLPVSPSDEVWHEYFNAETRCLQRLSLTLSSS